MSRCLTPFALLAVVGLMASRLFAADDPKPEPKPARFAKEIQAFVDADVKSPPAEGQVLFVGSSSIRLWKLKDSFPELDCLNRGFGGSQIADSVMYADKIVLPYKPRLIVMYAGDNDIAGGKSPETLRDDFRAFVAKVHARLPDTKIIFIAVKPSPSRWKFIDKQRAANGLIAADCQADKSGKLVFLDIEKPMLGPDGQPNEEFFVADKLHMSPAGYKIWAGLLEPLLAK